MKIMIANHSGYCYGVKRAIKILDDLITDDSNGKQIFTLGPIIHNAQVTEHYRERGINVISELIDIDANSKEISQVVIRSHGAPKAVYDEADERGLDLLDATCPYVKKIQNTVSTHASNGYNIIIVGDPKHPEVIGINGWCNDNAVILESVEDAESLVSDINPVCVVAQTTFNLKTWEKIIDVLKQKFKNCVIQNTICLATNQRQTACRELAKEVDCMIVIGGKHSSNTIKLANICKDIVQTYHIETKDDLDLSVLSGYEVIGITAGASTPDWIIDSVILKIENEGEVFFDGKS